MKWFFILLILCAIIVGVLVYAPGYLIRADKPAQSQVVVLFLGVEFQARKQEAFKLIEEGYARYLIIPAYGRVSDAGLFQNHPAQINIRPLKDPRRNRSGNAPYPGYYEDTHIEVLEAKQMMDKAGFKSAIFVSSPYHMKRISLMAEKVFGSEKYRILFVPSRFQRQGETLWFLNKRDLKYVSSEYSKIVWFLLYDLFAPGNTNIKTNTQPPITDTAR